MKLDKACFQHDMAYGDFKNLNRTTASDKVLSCKTFHIAEDPKYDECQRGLAALVYKVFDKNFSDSGIKNENMPGKQLPEELHKAVTRKLNKRKVNSPFMDNVWDADLGDLQFLGFTCLLCVINIYRKYAWIISLKDKKGIRITNAHQKT